MTGLTRRQLLLATCAAAGTLAKPWLSRRVLAASKPVVAALFCGHIDDNGFMQAGYQGFKKAMDQLALSGHYKDQVANETQAQIAALRELATHYKPDLLIAHGGQNTDAALAVAKEFPDIRLVITQGAVTASNLSSYDVRQEESAWLAGA